MRLDEKEKQLIIKYAKSNFGEDIHLYLFGSRVVDGKKGGDIDLFLDSKSDIDMEKQLAFFTDIFTFVTTRKIDLLVKTPSAKDKSIYHVAKEEGILLC